MSVRDVLVRFRADVGDFTSKVGEAKASVGALKESVDRASTGEPWKKASTAATIAGGAITAAVGLMVKSAIDWESAWAGVVKTASDDSPEALAKLSDELRSMASELPASAVEIANVAAAAGQLGIKTADVGAFTRTMIDLGEATNLTAEQSATAIAQIANVMGTSTADVGRFGSALVALGNTSATTESDILAMTQRLAAVGSILGMSETDVLGYAAALSSVGVEAEAGGTALTQTFSQIATAVRDGGAELELIAQTAGMTGDQFKQAFTQDAAGALNTFITGLSAVESSGGSAASVLDTLGMTGVRQSNALLALAGAGDLLSRSLDTASEAWDANSALAEEVARRYETTESRIKVASNNLTLAGAEVGAVFLPVLADLADRTAGVAQAFGSLPAPVHTALGGLGAVAGVSLLAVGGFMKLVTGVNEARQQLADITKTIPGLDGKLKGLGVAAGVAAAAMAVLVAGQVIHDLTNVKVSAEEATVALKNLTASGDISALDGVFNGAGVGVHDLDDALSRLGMNDGWSKFRQGAQELLGLGGDFIESKESLDALDASLSKMSKADAATAFQRIAERARELGITTEQLAAAFPQYAASLQTVAQQSGAAVSPTEALAAAQDKVKTNAQSAADAHKMLTESIREQASASLAASGSLISYYESIDKATEAAKKHTGGLNAQKTAFDLTTESGQQQARALDGVASAALQTVSAMEKNGASTDKVRGFTEQARESFIRAAQQMGLTRGAAEQMAAAYGLVPANVTTNVSAPGAPGARRTVEEFHEAVRRLPPDKQTDILSVFKRNGLDAANAALDRINGRVATTYVTTVYTSKGNMRAEATGGWVRDAKPYTKMAGGGFYGKVKGPGSWTSDSVGPVMLSDDEFVVKASRAELIERLRPGLLDWLNTDGAPLPKGLADGGGRDPFRFAPAGHYTPTQTSGATMTTVVELNVGGVRIEQAGSLDAALADLTDRIRLEALRAGVPGA